MAIIQNLSVSLTANTRRFSKGMRTARAEIAGFVSSVSRARNVVLGLAGGALAGAGLVGLATRTAQSVDQIGKLSRQLGIGTKALSQLSFVADRAGIPFQTLALALQRQTRRISEASVGTGEAVNALKELRLEATTLAKLEPDKAFQLITERIKQIEDPSRRVAVAFKIWDSEGVTLLRTLGDGKESVQALRKEADAFGLTVTEKLAGSAAKFNDQITNLKAQFTGLRNSIFSKVAPTLIGFLEKVNEKFPAIVEKARMFKDRLVEIAGEVNETITPNLSSMFTLAKRGIGEINNLFSGGKGLSFWLDRVANILEFIERTLVRLGRLSGGFAALGVQSGKGLFGAVQSIRESVANRESLKGTLQGVREQFAPAVSIGRDLFQQTKGDLGRTVRDLQFVGDQFVKPMTEEQEKTNELLTVMNQTLGRVITNVPAVAQ